MDNRVKFYSWLIGLLDRKHLTFEEIADEWKEARANQNNDVLDKRTFHRYRENIQSQFGISVECNKSDGYRYYLKSILPSMPSAAKPTSWRMSVPLSSRLAGSVKA